MVSIAVWTTVSFVIGDQVHMPFLAHSEYKAGAITLTLAHFYSLSELNAL
jgi:hypothetical protein